MPLGAGYKSNERPPTGRLRATFLNEVNCDRNYPANERTRVVREAHRGAYDRETIYKILDEGYVWPHRICR